MLSTNENDLQELDDLRPTGQFVGANGDSSLAVPVGRISLPPKSISSNDVRLWLKDLKITTMNYSVDEVLIFTERSALLEKPGVDLNLVRGFKLISKELEEHGIDFSTTGEIIHDPEKFESEIINVAFYISGMAYQDILRLWDTLSPKFASTLDQALRGKVHLVIKRQR